MKGFSKAKLFFVKINKKVCNANSICNLFKKVTINKYLSINKNLFHYYIFKS